MKTFSSLDIIIVNWNSGILLSGCLNSIKNASSDNFKLNRVVVVDNASTDNSLEAIVNFDLPLVLIKNRKNLGFSKACNQGAKNSNANYLLLLNPDTRLYNNSLSEPIQFLEKNENVSVGIIGIQLRDENNLISRNCSRFPTPSSLIYNSVGLDRLFPKIFAPHFMKEWDHQDSRFVDQVMGSFFFVRRTLFEKLNGYDERFFVYYEDLDFSYRAKKDGFKSYYLTTTKIYHKGGGTSEKVKAQRLAYILRSKLLFSKKHFSKSSYSIIFLITIFIEPFARIFGEIINGSFGNIPEILGGYKKLLIKIATSNNNE
jgi:GT2 family glycosyltransferase